MKRAFLILLILVLMLTGGCRWLRRPQPQPDPEDERRVEIPAEISQGPNQEPQLRVYMPNGETVTMDIEEYLLGVVAAEMDPEWPTEALAAQAIVARTFTLQKINEQGTLPNRDAHASTNIEEFQAYDASRINDNVREAVQMTRGEVAVYQGEFVRGWFHAFCGGRTTTPSVGLNFQGGDPEYLEPVPNPCPDAVDEDQRLWTKSFSLSQIRNAVREISGNDPGQVTSITIGEELEGRASTFKVNDVEVSAAELRLALGSTEMRATIINDISISGDRVTFGGTGFGHGVGLCQWGAKAWADEGRSPEQIVESFFPGTTIQELWD